MAAVGLGGKPLQINTHTGLLIGADYMPSPNCDSRPLRVEADLMVIHGISLPPGEFGGPWIDQLFANALVVDAHPHFKEIATLKVSSHLLLRRDGTITQYVKFHERAWHAGRSSYRGRMDCNDFSIGIELEGTDAVPYESAQYLALAAAIDALCTAYPKLSAKRLVGHSDIAPGRKTDPGPSFDWSKTRQSILDLRAKSR